VLRNVLVLNLVVAGAKIVFGFWSGAVSITSDGFHSLALAAPTCSPWWRCTSPPPDGNRTGMRAAVRTLCRGDVSYLFAPRHHLVVQTEASATRKRARVT
jgi:hypothetical protein